MSSDRLIILETLMPGAGSNSYKLTTGPLLTFFIFPLIPKSSKIFSINSGLGFFEVEIFVPCFFSNKFIAGSLYSFVLLSEKFLKEKDCCLISEDSFVSLTKSTSLFSTDIFCIFFFVTNLLSEACILLFYFLINF